MMALLLALGVNNNNSLLHGVGTMTTCQLGNSNSRVAGMLVLSEPMPIQPGPACHSSNLRCPRDSVGVALVGRLRLRAMDITAAAAWLACLAVAPLIQRHATEANAWVVVALVAMHKPRLQSMEITAATAEANVAVVVVLVVASVAMPRPHLRVAALALVFRQVARLVVVLQGARSHDTDNHRVAPHKWSSADRLS